MEAVEYLLQAASHVEDITDSKIEQIQGIMRRSRTLALNAAIESARAGTAGQGFSVVANEMKTISDEITGLASSLQGELRGQLEQLNHNASIATSELDKVRGERLADLAHNAVEIADRNLYERTCDVRWWATDPAVWECAADCHSKEKQEHASERLGVILQSYTVYLDLWIADTSGKVIANGRPSRYPNVAGRDVSNTQWFREAMATYDGTEFAVDDISREPALDNAVTATYSTAIRAGGETDGEIIGVLGIFFDWSAQAKAIVEGIRLSPEEWKKTRCLLIDKNHRIIAASDGEGILSDHFPLDVSRGSQGHYSIDDQFSVGYALTPGYETYEGLGWYGVITQWD
jgi:hypothetical protein